MDKVQSSVSDDWTLSMKLTVTQIEATLSVVCKNKVTAITRKWKINLVHLPHCVSSAIFKTATQFMFNFTLRLYHWVLQSVFNSNVSSVYALLSKKGIGLWI